ncbi:MAG: ATP-binding protein [Minisyncoccales bacterium]
MKKIKRVLFEQLKLHLTKKEISFIIGPRQAGKTTLMLFLKEHLEGKRKKTIFLNLDIERDKQFVVSQEKLIKKIQLEIGKEKGYVFIDEIQRKENAGVFLKGIYDMDLPYKFIVSGSGSVELKGKIQESLVGRKRIFNLNVLSFEEFVNFRTNYKYEKKLSDFFEIDKEKTRELFEEYLNFGGYPRVVLEDRLEEKKKFIDEIYQSYLEKDISYFLGVQKTEEFTNLVRIMASQIGNLVNFSELSSTLGISVKTVKNYLWYLQKTFILEKLVPYFKNVRKEITKTPIFYFNDLGLKNYSLGEFGNVTIAQNLGFLFENFIFNILKEKIYYSPSRIHFWRTKDGAEVDFIVDTGKEIIPIEVKCQELKEPEVPRSLKNFILKYQPRNAFLVNLGLKKEIKLNKTRIHFIPFYEVISPFRNTNHQDIITKSEAGITKK